MAHQLKKAQRKAVKKSNSSLKVVKRNDSLEMGRSTAVGPADNTPEGMIMTALNNGRSMEEIGTLIKYRNDEIARLARLDFLESKKQFTRLRKRIVKGNTADFGTTQNGRQGAKYKYEDLDIIDETIKDVASDCGFSWEWKTEYKDDFLYITCILSHIGGHHESDTMRGKPDTSGGKNSIQSDGSTTSYLMRYTLKKVLGLSTGKDDNDGQQGAKNAINVIAKLVKPDAELYKSLLKSVQAKTITIEQLEKAYQFTDEQMVTLKEMES